MTFPNMNVMQMDSEDIPVYLAPENLSTIEDIMLGRVSVDGQDPRKYSLTGQMDVLGLGCSPHPIPDVIALTLDTAAPLGDVFRGIFEAAGIETPLIIGIKANRTKAFIHRIAPEAPEVLMEMARIAAIIGDASSAVVVDEYIDQGDTMRYGKSLMLGAGVETCGMIGGKWYQHVVGNQYAEKLTSDFAAALSAIGRCCYAEYIANQTN